MTDSSSSAPVTGVDYAKSYLTLFAAHWFGARRFDTVDHEGFDPEDVQAYRAQKSAYLKKNFTRSRSVLRPEPESSPSSPTHAEAAAEAAAEAEAEQQPAPEAAAHDAEEGGGVPAASGGGEAAQVVTSKQLLPKFVVFQSVACCLLWLVFTLQKVIAGDSFQGSDGWLAGLDSIARGTTDLRWAGPACEDYRPEIWRWLTYQWTHIGVGHLFANTAMLVLLGTSLEGHEGTLRMAVIFNLGVMGGAFFYYVFEGHSGVVGASGGVYALVGVHFADLVLNWRVRHFRKLTLAVLLLFLFVDALTFSMSEDLSKADFLYSVSLGGVITGFISGCMIGRTFLANRRDSLMVVLLGVIGGALALFCLTWLGVNEAPRNIWEAAAGESGYCWVRQVFNSTLNSTNYQCIRCGTQSCISEWSQQDDILPVSRRACAAEGWYYDGR